MWPLYFLSLIAGLVYPLGFPSASFSGSPLFALFSVALFFFSLGVLNFKRKPSSLGQDIIKLLLFSFGYFASGYYWLGYTLNEFGGLPFPLNYLVASCFTFFITPHFFVFVLIHHFLFKKVPLSLQSLRPFNVLLVFSFLLTSLEYFIPQQFPAHLGHTWLNFKPFLRASTFFGSPIYSFLSYILIFSFLLFKANKTFSKTLLSLVLVVVAWDLSSPLNWHQKKNISSLNLRVVQGNIGNFMKVASESGDISLFQQVLNRYRDLSLAPSKKPLELLVWPETAYPALLNSPAMMVAKELVPEMIQKVLKESKAKLFTGSYDVATGLNRYEFENEHSAAFLFNRDGEFEGVFHKSVLIPFGESLPFGFLNPIFSKLIKNIAFFARGETFPLFEAKKDVGFISAICYEILFPYFVRNYLNLHQTKADFIVNITNDSWYGRSSEPYQHKFLAHWRALEFQLPIVRSTNTGITSVLYPDGSESKQLGLYETKSLDIELEIKEREKTLYQSFGFLSLTFLALFLLISYALQNLLLKGREV